MIKVFTGPMFSGKSDALLNEYDKRYHKSRILLFKPKMDTRDYGVVKTRKGKIYVESELGKGSTFVIILPVNPEI